MYDAENGHFTLVISLIRDTLLDVDKRHTVNPSTSIHFRHASILTSLMGSFRKESLHDSDAHRKAHLVSSLLMST